MVIVTANKYNGGEIWFLVVGSAGQDLRAERLMIIWLGQVGKKVYDKIILITYQPTSNMQFDRVTTTQ